MNFETIKKQYPSLYIYISLGDELWVDVKDLKRTSQKHVSIYVPFIFDFTYSKFQETYTKKIYTLKIIT